MPAGVSAWTPLANITLASTANTVTFSSISGAYKDLRLVLVGGAAGTGGGAGGRTGLERDQRGFGGDR